MPHSFQSVEFRRVRGEIVNLYIPAMGREPMPDLAIFVVGSVVLDQEDFLRKVTSDHPLQVSHIGGSIEDFLKVVKEPACVEFDRSKGF